MAEAHSKERRGSRRRAGGLLDLLRKQTEPSDFEDLLTEDYYEVYSEAHRRRPTLYEFPGASLHVSLYYPGKFYEVRQFLRMLFEHFDGWEVSEHPGMSELLDPEKASLHIYDYYSRESLDPRQHRVLFDFKCRHHDQTTWRIVCQREYVAVTLQTQFEVEAIGDGRNLIKSSFFDEGFEISERTAASIPADGHTATVTDLLYGELQTAMRRAMDAVIVGTIDRWQAAPSAARGYRRRRPEIFGNFYGCTLPWQTFEDTLAARRGPGEPPTVNRPLFPRPAAGGFAPSIVQSEALASTERFLADIWLNIAPHVMDSYYNDCVACYLEQGHSIYVSNLGSQRDSRTKSPLKYILFFDQEAFDRPDAIGAPLGSRAGLSRSAVWRLSRLINRLHDIGTVRLAALRYMGVMLKYEQRLRHIEFDVQHSRTQFEDLSKLQQLEERLTRYSQGIPDLIMDRAARTERYYHELISLSEDLGVLPIPSWQSYEQFVKRRLFSTLETVTSLGTKYQEVRDTITNISNTNIATKIFSLQTTAELFAGILLLYYIPTIFEEAINHLPELNWSFWGWKYSFDVHHFISNNLVYYIGILVALGLCLKRPIVGILRWLLQATGSQFVPRPIQLPRKATTEKFQPHR